MIVKNLFTNISLIKISNLKIILLILFLCLCHEFPYWINTMFIHGLSLDTVVMSRPDDAAYNYLYNSLDKLFQTNLTFTFEGVGTGLIRTPFITLLPEIIFYNLFGKVSILFMDIFYKGIFIFLFWHLLRLFGLKDLLALFISVIAPFLLPIIEPYIIYYGGIAFKYRIPRPNISILFFLLSLISLIKIKYSNQIKITNIWPYSLGAATSFLLQSNIYEAQIILIMFFYIFFLINKNNVIERITLFSSFAIPFLCLSLPFFLQSYFGAHDNLQRGGLHEVKDIFHAIHTYLYILTRFGALQIILTLVYVIFLYSYFNKKSLLKSSLSFTNLFFFLLFSSCILSFPISTLITGGMVIQPIHYWYELATCFDILLCFAIGITLQYFFLFLKKKKSKIYINFNLFRNFFILMLALMFTVMAFSKDINTPISRSEDPTYQTLIDSNNTLKFLNNYSGKEVIATNSNYIGSWWVGFKGGNLLLPHVSVTSISDEEIDLRIVTFSKILGMNSKQFNQLIRSWNMIDAFNGSFKYLVTTHVRIGEKYEIDLKEVPDSIFAKAPTAIPLEVLENFNKIYDNYKTQNFKCDLIVLYNKDKDNPGIVSTGWPSYEIDIWGIERKVFENLKIKYKLVYENNSYIVFEL